MGPDIHVAGAGIPGVDQLLWPPRQRDVPREQRQRPLRAVHQQGRGRPGVGGREGVVVVEQAGPHLADRQDIGEIGPELARQRFNKTSTLADLRGAELLTDIDRQENPLQPGAVGHAVAEAVAEDVRIEPHERSQPLLILCR